MKVGRSVRDGVRPRPATESGPLKGLGLPWSTLQAVLALDKGRAKRFTTWELLGRGSATSVMLSNDRGDWLNVSHPRVFTGHAEARRWAEAYFAEHDLNLPETRRGSR
jgi:hypothetical protein